MKLNRNRKNIYILVALLVLTSGAFILKTFKEVKPVRYVHPQANDTIVSAEVTNTCDIKVSLSSSYSTHIKTSFSNGGYQEKCDEKLFNIISPSKKYLVYFDLQGGLDSAVRIYSVDKNETAQLESFGTASVFDMAFLPGDKLAILHGYRDLFDEQYLEIVDIPNLFKDYSLNIDSEYMFFKNMNKYSKNTTLPNKKMNYVGIEVVGDKVLLFDSKNSDKVLKEYYIKDVNP